MTPSTFGFFFDFAITSPASVRGVPSDASVKNFALSSTRIVTPSATNGGRPPE